MAVEVRGGEERCCLVLNKGLLIRLGRDPENNDIGIALTRVGIDRVRPRIAEEKERLPAHLVDGIVTAAVLDGDVRHGQGEFVHVLYSRRPASVPGHSPSVCGVYSKARSWTLWVVTPTVAATTAPG